MAYTLDELNVTGITPPRPLRERNQPGLKKSWCWLAETVVIAALATVVTVIKVILGLSASPRHKKGPSLREKVSRHIRLIGVRYQIRNNSDSYT